jgi:hypothetical protein
MFYYNLFRKKLLAAVKLKKNLSWYTRIKACEAEESLQIVLMSRFCNFNKTKP